MNQRLTGALGHEVTLWPLMPADDLDHYRRGAPDSEDMLEELRDDLRSYSRTNRCRTSPVFPPEILEFESPPGSYVDAFPLMVMTTSALAFAGQRLFRTR